jgi:fibronectin type 3 domain-containing protein
MAAPTALTYTDINLTNGQTYYYKVSAVNSAGESSLTERVAATPIAQSTQDNNTMIYVGIGAVILVVMVGATMVLMRRRK